MELNEQWEYKHPSGVNRIYEVVEITPTHVKVRLMNPRPTWLTEEECLEDWSDDFLTRETEKGNLHLYQVYGGAPAI